MPPGARSLKTAGIVSALGRCPLFRGLPGDVLQDIATFTAIKSLERGDYLFRENDPATGFFVVQLGAINVHRVNTLGKGQVIHIFRSGESFAEGTLATDHGYPADAVAAEPSQVLHVAKADFVAMVYRQPHLAIRMLATMSKHLRDLVGQIDDLQLKSVETRLTNWLLTRCPDTRGDDPHTFTLSASKNVVAAEVGTVAATLSRTFAKLHDKDLLTVRGKEITVHAPAAPAAHLRAQLGD